MSKFKVGDKVRILPSAVSVGVRQSDVDTIQTVIKIIDPITIEITDSGDGSWWVEPDQIKHAVVKGEQLLFSFMSE